MGVFDQMIRGGYAEEAPTLGSKMARPRSIVETIDDQIVYHERKLAELRALKETLTPEILAFVEAMHKCGF